MSKPTASQLALAKMLEKQCKNLCKKNKLRRQGCNVQQFCTVIERYQGRVPQMGVELEQCVLWCVSNRKKMFTILRFHNWCRNKVKWAKRDEHRLYEEKCNTPYHSPCH